MPPYPPTHPVTHPHWRVHTSAHQLATGRRKQISNAIYTAQSKSDHMKYNKAHTDACSPPHASGPEARTLYRPRLVATSCPVCPTLSTLYRSSRTHCVQTWQTGGVGCKSGTPDSMTGKQRVNPPAPLERARRVCLELLG